MSLIASIDVTTLLGCQVALNLIYAIVFLCMKRMYPYLRGAGSVALAFVTATIANVLLLLSGSLPPILFIFVSHCLFLSAFVLFYTGVLRFFRSQREIGYVWALTAVASALTAYFVQTHTHPKTLTWIIAISFFLVRGVIAVEIFRQAAGRIFLKIFAYLMAFYATFALNRIIFQIVYGAPPTQAQRDVLQTISVLLSVSFAFLIGLSFLLMLCGDLLTLVKDESERDLLCGVLNRRGIEQKLDTELKRAGRSNHKLSIALIDIDHFKPSTTAPDMQPATPPSATSSPPSPYVCVRTTSSAASAATNSSSSFPTPHVQKPSTSPLGSSSRFASFRYRVMCCRLPSASVSLKPPPPRSPALSSPAPTRLSTLPRTQAETAAASSSTRHTSKKGTNASFSHPAPTSWSDSTCHPDCYP